jgi:transcriptional regulator with XRE-family HTH domain
MEEKEMKHLGKKIKMFRTEKEMTQEEMAKRLGAFRYQLSSWEKGKKLIPTKYLLKICKEFQINLEYFDIYQESTNVQITNLPIQQ